MSIDELLKNATAPDERLDIVLRENARLRKEIVEHDTGMGLIRRVLEDVYRTPSRLRVSKAKTSRKKQQEIALLHMTDTHYGKKTETYNTAVCESRLLKLVEAVREITALRRNFAGINKLILLFGGDFVEGQSIFPSQAHHLDADLVCQAIKEGPEAYANCVLDLLTVFPEIEIHAVPGNHGQVDGRFGNPKFNADSICYEIIRSIVSRVPGAENITWNLPFDREGGRQWYCRFPITKSEQGMLVHGHQVKGSMGFSWYGWAKKAGGWRSSKETAGFRHLFGGHWHSHGVFDFNDTTIYATGSMESNNDYALETLAASGDPKQRLCFFNDSKALLVDCPLHLGG